MELKQCPKMKQFKKCYKDVIFMSYKERENVEIQQMLKFTKVHDVIYIISEICLLFFTADYISKEAGKILTDKLWQRGGIK